jgi:uncharacterized protein YgiM (DUF1202 family)
VSGRNRTTGTVVGAAAGAAAGSAIGCKLQHDDQKKATAQAPSYRYGEYQLAPGVEPASFSKSGAPYVVTRGANLRAGPGPNYNRLGGLAAGERFEALASVQGADWLLVGRGGVGVGYIHRDLVTSGVIQNARR